MTCKLVLGFKIPRTASVSIMNFYLMIIVFVCTSSITAESKDDTCVVPSDCREDYTCINGKCHLKSNLGESCDSANLFQCKGPFATCEKSKCVCPKDIGEGKTKTKIKELNGRCVREDQCDAQSDCESGYFCLNTFCWINPFTHKIVAPCLYIGVILLFASFYFGVRYYKKRLARKG